jgi:hypothetical protein
MFSSLAVSSDVLQSHIHEIRHAYRGFLADDILTIAADWEMWTAAILTDTTLRDTFISRLKNYLTDSFNNMPFSDWYDTVSGRSVGFRARPVAGGHLALVNNIVLRCMGYRVLILDL